MEINKSKETQYNIATAMERKSITHIYIHRRHATEEDNITQIYRTDIMYEKDQYNTDIHGGK